MRKGLLGLAIVALLAGLPALSATQPTPNGGSMQMQDPHRVVGLVDAFDGQYRLVVHGMRVRLHKGAVIHPTGASLHRGQFVTIRGSWVGHHFDANEIRIRQ